jgi:PAT family acetyl-CoA transporter-like MFS transporter 1
MATFESSDKSTNQFGENSKVLQENKNESYIATPFTRSDKVAIFLLTSLFTFVGMTMGFWTETVPILLAEYGATYTQIGIVTICVLPFSLKILVAPLIDAHYSVKLGRRKSWIVPGFYLFGVTMICFSFFVEHLLQTLDHIALMLCGFCFMIIAATCGAATSGWIVTLLSKPNVSYGSVCQSIGQALGGFLAYNMLIPLSSLEFSNKVIYSTPEDIAILPISTFCLGWGVYIFSLGFIIHIFKKEDDATQHYNNPTLKEIVSNMKGFYRNPNLRFYIANLFLWKVGFGPVDSIVNVMLVRRGFPKVVLASIQTVMIPVQFIAACLNSRIANARNEMKLYQRGLCVKIIENILLFGILEYFDFATNLNNTIILFSFAQFITVIQTNTIFIGRVSFNLRIADPTIGSTFLTVLASFTNFGAWWYEPIVLTLVDHMNYFYLCGVGLIYSLGFIGTTWQPLRRLEGLDQHELSLKYPPVNTTETENPTTALIELGRDKIYS